jgi:8-oxo-dGTP pyrophosphatase MutT (NUDIX family)
VAEPGPAAVLRHLTVTGLLVYEGRALVHWHARNLLWLPPGGHIEPNEDPVQAVLREVQEETGLAAAILPTIPLPPLYNIGQLPPPAAMLVAPVRSCSVAGRAGWTGPIEHIDLVYYCRPVAGLAGFDPGGRRDPLAERGPSWRRTLPFTGDGGDAAPVPDDVRVLALAALRHAASATGAA